MTQINKRQGSDDGRGTTRRRVLQTGAVVSGIGLAGCMGGGDDTLRYISRGGTTQDAEREMFEEWSEDSGIDVQHQEAADDTEMINLIAENPGEFDFTNPAQFGLALERIEHDGELFDEIDTGEIPNYEENVQDQWKEAPPIDGEDDAIFYYMSSQGIGYNQEHVDEITSWDDLKDDDLAGHVALFGSPPTRFGNCCAALEYDVGEVFEDEDMFEDVFDEMEEQNEYVFNYWDAGDQFMQWMREDQAYACSAWGGRVQVLNEEGMDTEFVIPDEGAVAHTNYFVMTQESENQEHVYDLLDWLYEPDRAVELSTSHNYPMAMEDPSDELTELFEYVEDPDDLLWIDWDSMIPNLDEITERVNDVMAG
ncbi:ABC transporter substrate-binding protein [Natronorubrum daqingense]|uniref:Spermidine/putrescine-binding protein n=2 Tax=Natronorubrum daqingense TaxID=588898 RepID=A0A1N7D2S9_9EURY|nr:PotD/PotF family extracellular solute-binding protein [Natronorubrum daqingense]SIR70186.1 Spermidine/putrescine-binding protein [Natronorubrum daqingense]